MNKEQEIQSLKEMLDRISPDIDDSRDLMEIASCIFLNKTDSAYYKLVIKNDLDSEFTTTINFLNEVLMTDPEYIPLMLNALKQLNDEINQN